MKKLFLFCLIISASFVSLFAAEWWEGKKILKFEISDLKNVSVSSVNSVLYEYRNVLITPQLAEDIQNSVSKINGIKQVGLSAVQNGDGVTIIIDIAEYPYIESIKFMGNTKVRTGDLNSALTAIALDDYIDLSVKTQFDVAISELKAVYLSKGFAADMPITYTTDFDESTNRVSVVFSIEEGVQNRISSISFEGNVNISTSVLKKQLTSKSRSLFNNGFLDNSKITADISAIEQYYSSIGYIEAKVVDVRYDETEVQTEKYRDLDVTFVVSEGNIWYYGGTTVTGNSIFPEESIMKILSMKVGSPFNLVKYTEDLTSVASLYYDNGYITSNMIPSEKRDEETRYISFDLKIEEGPQSVIEEIKITGLKKTKEYVMRRELEFSEGDVFSRAKLITSAQNMYNTGLLSDIDYDLYYGQNQNGIIVEFKLTEGRAMDIQFGASFGGVSTGFPITGTLKLSNTNLGGTARTISVSTDLGSNTQTVSVSLGDKWVGKLRWANNISFSFSHDLFTGELQKGLGSDFSTGRNTSDVWPLGYVSAKQFVESKYANPSSQYLMDYRILSLSLAYTTSYTIIFDVGRLSFSGGLGLSLNRAIYDSSFVPFESLINKYGERWQFSNKLTLGIQWDGRDYVRNTTKGYLLNASVTYAGGFLQGLSNYIKVSVTAAGYLKLFTIGDPEANRNVVLSGTSSFGIMLPQYWKSEGSYDWYDPKLGATKMEMLYIDGWTTARGFDFVSDQSLMWDNLIEVSVPIVVDILEGVVYFSGTAAMDDFYTSNNSLDWYFSTGLGVRLKISGFPLGVYFVKTASYFNEDGRFKWINGSVFPNLLGGFKVVLAISNSIF